MSDDNDGNDADHIVMMMVITVMVHLQCFNGHYGDYSDSDYSDDNNEQCSDGMMVTM